MIQKRRMEMQMQAPAPLPVYREEEEEEEEQQQQRPMDNYWVSQQGSLHVMTPHHAYRFEPNGPESDERSSLLAERTGSAVSSDSCAI
jgi:hypothetical protein